MAPASDAELLGLFERLALDAGRAIMEVYNSDFAVISKADDSPVTEADRRAETIILAGLRAHCAGTACVAEEEVAAGITPPDLGKAFFLIDPLDGTKEFTRKGDDFTVNIALIRDGVPQVGVVYAPARRTLYTGRPGLAETATVSEAHDVVLSRRAVRVRAACAPIAVVASKSHRTPDTDAFIDRLPAAEIVSVGSSLKFCLVATGEADLYPRFGRTMEWDTAAGDAVLRAAGGKVVTLDGVPLAYGKRNQADDSDFANPYFIASSGAVPLA